MSLKLTLLFILVSASFACLADDIIVTPTEMITYRNSTLSNGYLLEEAGPSFQQNNFLGLPREQTSVSSILQTIPTVNFNFGATAVDPDCPWWERSFQTENFLDIDAVIGRCDRQATDNPYVSGTPIIKQLDKFRNICACYANPNSVQGSSIPPANAEFLQRIFGSKRAIRITDPAAVTQNLQTEAYLLRNLVEGVQLQASFLSGNLNDAQRFSHAFAQNYLHSGRRETDSLRTTRESLQNAYRKAGLTGTAELPQLRFNPDMLTGAGSDTSCVSPRDFAAFRQFPQEPAFYNDLAQYNLDSCNNACKDWDYEELMKDLDSQTKGRILTLAEARTDPAVSVIVRRLDFLHRNPLIKSALSAHMRPGEKKEILSMIKANFTGNQESALKNSERFRQQLSTFMDVPRRAEEIREEGMRHFNKVLLQLPARVTTTQHLATASDLGSLQPSFLEQTGRTFSVTDTGKIVTSPVNRFSTEVARQRRMEGIVRICPKLVSGDITEKSYVFNELEREWAQEAGASSIESGLMDYNAFQNIVCEGRRASPEGAPVNFNDWLNGRCTQDAACRTDRRARVAEFIRAYPISNTTINPDPGLGYATMAENLRIVDLPTEAAARAGTVGATSFREAQTATTSSLRGDYIVPYSDSGSRLGSADQIGRAQISPSTSGSASSSTSAIQNNSASGAAQQVSGSMAFVPSGDVPLAQTPVAREAQQRTEIIRSQVRAGESDAQALRDELSSLRNDLQRQTASAPRDSQELASLTARFETLEADLKSRLESRERENKRLRKDLSRAERESQGGAPSQVADQGEDSERSSVLRSSGGISSTEIAQVAPQAGQQSVAGAATNISGLQSSASLGGVSRGTSLAPVARSAPSAGISRSLSQFGVQSTTSRDGIVIANPSSTTDYQSLRARSEQSFISRDIPAAEFNLLASYNQEALKRYLDQVRSMPAEVVRLSFTSEGTSNQLELFVVKSADGISIVPSNGASRAIASPSPAEPTDRARLIDLQGRLANPGQ